MGDEIDFAAEGLLDGLEGRAREARCELLRRLAADGYELEELRESVAYDLLPLLYAEEAVGGRSKYTAQEVADESGLSVELLIALRRANGLPTPELGVRAFNDADLELSRQTKGFAEAGLSEEQMIATTRVLGRGLAQASEVMRSLVLEMALQSGADELELADRYRAIVEQLVPMISPMLDGQMMLHLRNVVRTEAVTAAERESGQLPGAREVGVAFADLVGFTKLGEEVPPDELGGVADRLSVITSELVEPPVRFVKTIGDAAMLVSPDVEPLIDATLALVAAADAEGQDFPQLRAGVALGPALARAGDWYGRPVNLASRITTVARAGSVLATRELRDATPERYRWSSAGARSFKGVSGSTRLYRARALDPPAESS